MIGWDQKKSFLLTSAVAIFCYSVAVMFLYQHWLVEYLSSTAVNGLIAGDPQYYHELAVQLSERMKVEGWSAWNLRPLGHGSAGLLSVLYYY